MAESRGMDVIRIADGSILFRAILFDAVDAKIVAGAVTLRLWHFIPATGALETYDFNDDTFKAGAVVTATAGMTYRMAENATYDTGLWTYRHAVLTDFEVGDKYAVEVTHADLPRPVSFEFQYGDGDAWVPNTGLATAGGATSISLATSAEAVNDSTYVGSLVAIVGGTGIGQARIITAYDAAGGATDRLCTVNRAWAVNPAAGSVYVIIPKDELGLVDAVWDEDVTGHVVASSAGAALDALGTAIDGRANNANLNALLAVPDVAANTIAYTIWDALIAAHVGAGTTGENLDALGTAIAARANNANLNALLGVPDFDGATAGVVAVGGTAEAGSSATLIVDTANRVEADADYWVGSIVVMKTGNAIYQARAITDFDQVTDTITVSPAFTSAVAAGDDYVILQSAIGSSVLSPVTIAAIADAVWDEDIVAGHGTADTAGLLLRVLGAAISVRVNNSTLDDLLGVPDTAATDTVCGQVWEETLAGHNTVGSMGEVMNNIAAAAYPTVVAIADAVWDEDIVAAHGTADTAGLLLRALGYLISTRVNNPNLNALLGVADVAATNLSDAIWDEDLTAHTTVDTSGNLITILGKAIQDRANNGNLDALLGVVDSAGADIAWTVLDEVISGAAHTTADSVAQRLYAMDILTEVGGTGDLTETYDQCQKVDKAACDGPAVADSLADKMDDALALLALADRALCISVNLEGIALRIEVCQEQYGVVVAGTWTQCAAQIFDEAGAIVANIGVGDFGAITGRGFFQYTLSPHLLTAGKTYQIEVTLTDGGLLTFQNTKLFKVINV